MRFVFRLLLFVIIAVILFVGFAIVIAIEDRPLVPFSDTLSSSDVERAKQLFARYDPRKLKAGAVENAEVSERDLNLLTNHAVNLVARGGAMVDVGSGWLKGRATLELPGNPVGPYLNVVIDLQAADGLPRFERLRVGGISVPGWLANFGTVKVLDAYFEGRGTGLVSEFIQSVAFDPGLLRVAYRWPADAVERVRTRIVPREAGERLRDFHDRLVKVTSKSRRGAAVSLLEVMKPLFELADNRSNDGDAAAENGAAIITLSAYVNGRSVKSIVPEASGWPRPNRITITLHGREDSARHYLTSAALSALGGGALSKAIGLFKEVDDSRGGSGFSFNDLAADRAGTRLGELAVGSDLSARTVQLRIGLARRETDVMPDVRDLPERMSEAEFNRRYGGIDSPAYHRVTQDIDGRISKTRLYR